MISSLCLLLLVSLPTSTQATDGQCLEDSENLRVWCEAGSLLWGWFNVTTESMRRARGLLEQISNFTQEEKELENNVKSTKEKVFILLGGSTDNRNAQKNSLWETVRAMEQQYTDDHGKRKDLLEQAKEKAHSSIAAATEAYYTISLSCVWMEHRMSMPLGKEIDEKGLRERLVLLSKTGGSCQGKGKVANTLLKLNKPPELFDTISLDAWKAHTVKVLAQAREELQLHMRVCRTSAINSLVEKAKVIDEEIWRTVEGLRIAMKDYETAKARLEGVYLTGSAYQTALGRVKEATLDKVDALLQQRCQTMKGKVRLQMLLKQSEESRKNRKQRLSETQMTLRKMLERQQLAEGHQEKGRQIFLNLRMALGTSRTDAGETGASLFTANKGHSSWNAADGLFMSNTTAAKEALLKAEKALVAAERLVGDEYPSVANCNTSIQRTVNVPIGADCDGHKLEKDHISSQYYTTQTLVSLENEMLAHKNCKKILDDQITVLEEKLATQARREKDVEASMETADRRSKERDNSLAHAVSVMYHIVLRAKCGADAAIRSLQAEAGKLETEKNRVASVIREAKASAQTAKQVTKNVRLVPKEMLHNLNTALSGLDVAERMFQKNINQQAKAHRQLMHHVALAEKNKSTNRPAETGLLSNNTYLDRNDLSLTGNCERQQLAALAKQLTEGNSSLETALAEVIRVGEIVAGVRSATWEYEDATKGLSSQRQEQSTRINQQVKNVKQSADLVQKEVRRLQREHFARKMQSLMEDMCGYAMELNSLNQENTAFRSETDALEAVASEEYRKIQTNRVVDQDVREYDNKVEQAFEYASGRIALLRTTINRLSENQAAMVKKIRTKIMDTRIKENKQGATSAWRLTETILSNLEVILNEHVCTPEQVKEMVKALLQITPEHSMGYLNETDTMKSIVATLQQTVKTAKQSLEQVASQATLARKAVSCASEAAEESSCTPLHRQLLNVLQHIW
ncbi:hypothetical protein ERJ75_000085000 [Trypanosoma vivax]|uniref:Uncharacterized protein n=1 Tax=Trypanosoma vivax (strain Y486) TaxID=1055687 RepID=F9WLP6_TRYVY|nr:hypothetical protein ERJ75_000182300 [Trypanosoma vivax]KAH8620328.1 hypothetical protein ERJ75_000085000 [Trypanosoma vivax]CCD18438.1 hypothetical protein, conserved in T. vivax [Trypanosoma vivax Y486]|eukprot:CCD18438.1 hypothetical protein, conserved in T. vivax [Trypanosoma vivax Y486]